MQRKSDLVSICDQFIGQGNGIAAHELPVFRVKREIQLMMDDGSGDYRRVKGENDCTQEPGESRPRRLSYSLRHML